MIWIIWIPENYLSERCYDQVVPMSKSTQTKRQRVRTEIIGVSIESRPSTLYTNVVTPRSKDVGEHNRQRLPGPHSLITIIN